MITMKEVIKQMDTTDPKGLPNTFDIEFVTFDRKRKTGGKILKLEKVRLTNRPKRTKAPVKTKKTASNNKSKAPMHFEHYTKNLMLPNGQIRKVHLSLVTRFNGIKVL